MIIIPGWLIAMVTFPGVIVHEAAHMLFCRIRQVAVLDVCFIRIGNPSGYVIHEAAPDFTSHFLISVGPFIVNTVLCFVLCFPAFLRFRAFNMADPLSVLLLWLGISIGMHAFPSNQDASSLLKSAKVSIKKLHPLAIISFPLIGLIYIANLLRFFWFDYLYGAAIGLGLPEIILKHAV